MTGRAMWGRHIPALKTIRPHRLPGTSSGDFPSKAWPPMSPTKMFITDGTKALAL